jgi:hypothetical protein
MSPFIIFLCFVLDRVHQVHCAIIQLDRVKKLLVDNDLHQILYA